MVHPGPLVAFGRLESDIPFRSAAHKPRHIGPFADRPGIGVAPGYIELAAALRIVGFEAGIEWADLRIAGFRVEIEWAVPQIEGFEAEIEWAVPQIEAEIEGAVPQIEGSGREIVGARPERSPAAIPQERVA